MLHLFWLDNPDVVLNELQGLNCLEKVLLVEVLLVGVVRWVLLGNFGHKLVESLWLLV